MSDPINPSHYRSHPSGVECITITEHMNFCLGNALKYIWRAGLKSASPVEDLQKARWYLDREIERLKADDNHKQKLADVQPVHSPVMCCDGIEFHNPSCRFHRSAGRSAGG